jgi:hypothetical protein
MAERREDLFDRDPVKKLSATITMWRLLEIDEEQFLIGWMSGQPDGPGWIVSERVQKIDRSTRTAHTTNRVYTLGHEPDRLPGGALDCLGDALKRIRRRRGQPHDHESIEQLLRDVLD